MQNGKTPMNYAGNPSLEAVLQSARKYHIHNIVVYIVHYIAIHVIPYMHSYSTRYNNCTCRFMFIVNIPPMLINFP